MTTWAIFWICLFAFMAVESICCAIAAKQKEQEEPEE